jgi:hypothetical protein
MLQPALLQSLTLKLWWLHSAVADSVQTAAYVLPRLSLSRRSQEQWYYHQALSHRSMTVQEMAVLVLLLESLLYRYVSWHTTDCMQPADLKNLFHQA